MPKVKFKTKKKSGNARFEFSPDSAYRSSANNSGATVKSHAPQNTQQEKQKKRGEEKKEEGNESATVCSFLPINAGLRKQQWEEEEDERRKKTEERSRKRTFFFFFSSFFFMLRVKSLKFLPYGLHCCRANKETVM